MRTLSVILMLMLITSVSMAWDRPILVSDKVGAPQYPQLNWLIADSTELTFDLKSLNGVAYLAYAEWDEPNYRHYAKIGAYNQSGELWQSTIEVPSPFNSTLPSQVETWREKIYVIGQITFTNPWSVSPFIARFDTLGNQEWFTLLITPTTNVLLWGPQLSTNPVNRIGMVHFTTNTAKFQLVNLENGVVTGPAEGYFLPLWPTIGYCSFSYRPAWLNGAWWFIHRSAHYFPVVIASVNPLGTTTSVPINWSYYSADGVFPSLGDSLAAILPNELSTQLILARTSTGGVKGSEAILAPIPSDIWSIYDSRQANDGTIATVLIRDVPAFSADVTIIKTDNSVMHTVLSFDDLPASCQAEMINGQTLGLTRSVNQNLMFTAISLNDGAVLQEDTVGSTGPPASANWSDLCGDRYGGAFVAWYVEEGISFPGHLYLQWIQSQVMGANNQVVTNHHMESSVSITPNPFNPTTIISYQLSANSFVSLKVYNTAGRLVSTLVNAIIEAGNHEANFDGSHLPSGVYLARLETGNSSQTQKLVLVK